MNTQQSKTDYDVIVIGGGTAGTIAAIQSARAGAKTLLVEKNSMLGGTMTMGGVNYPGLFFAWGKQVIAGIGWDLMMRCHKESGETPQKSGHRFAEPHCGYYHIHVDRFIFAMICDEAVVESGAEILFHTMIAGVESIGDNWKVTLCTKTGLQSHSTKVLIDCTGDANAVIFAGLPVNRPDEVQPSTLCCHASGYDFDSLDIAALNKAYEEAVKRGELEYTDACWNMNASNVAHWLRKGGENGNHLHHFRAGDSAGKTQLELAGRKSLLRLYRFLRTQPGLENLRFEHIAPECGVRETVTIRGKVTITVDDYVKGKLWKDALCYSFYPVDLHVSSGTGTQWEPHAEGIVPTIPRRALLPEGSRNLIAAGRIISSDRLANSGLRVEGPCMAMGQAAGAMAALAAATGVEVESVPLADVHAVLRENNAIIPE